ncbi:MAG: hypothetical protein JW881_15895 [Spirochaetales bacterium]|nr:hypothetical protein [Spirochaetales bacterium]
MEKTGKLCRWYHVCPMKYFYERGLLEEKWVAGYCWVSNPSCVRKKYEERGEYHPDNMLPDGSIRKDLKR